jgi:hypothetical protein
VLVEIIHFDETNPGYVVYAAHNRGIVPGLQLCNHHRLGWIRWSVATVLNVADLVPCDNAADYSMLPVIIRAD